MFRNASMFLKKRYTFPGKIKLNFRDIRISCRAFIIPHIRCIDIVLFIVCLKNNSYMKSWSAMLPSRKKVSVLNPCSEAVSINIIPSVKTICIGILQMTVKLSPIGFASYARLKYSGSINLIYRLSSSDYWENMKILKTYHSRRYLWWILKNQLYKHLIRSHLSNWPILNHFVRFTTRGWDDFYV